MFAQCYRARAQFSTSGARHTLAPTTRTNKVNVINDTGCDRRPNSILSGRRCCGAVASTIVGRRIAELASGRSQRAAAPSTMEQLDTPGAGRPATHKHTTRTRRRPSRGPLGATAMTVIVFVCSSAGKTRLEEFLSDVRAGKLLLESCCSAANEAAASVGRASRTTYELRRDGS